MQFYKLASVINQLQPGTMVYMAWEQDLTREGVWRRKDQPYAVQFLGARNPDEEAKARKEVPMSYVGLQGVFKTGVDDFTGEDEIREYGVNQVYVAPASGGGKRRNKKTRKGKRSSKKTMRRRR